MIPPGSTAGGQRADYGRHAPPEGESPSVPRPGAVAQWQSTRYRWVPGNGCLGDARSVVRFRPAPCGRAAKSARTFRVAHRSTKRSMVCSTHAARPQGTIRRKETNGCKCAMNAEKPIVAERVPCTSRNPERASMCQQARETHSSSACASLRKKPMTSKRVPTAQRNPGVVSVCHCRE